MSDLSPLSGGERKSNFGAVRSVDGPIPEVGLRAMGRLVVSDFDRQPLPRYRTSFGGSDASRVDSPVRGDVIDLAARSADIH